ncbi:hypothetical protein [Peptoniphilus harei]|uniref:hypothetical protein n=1 Tax=Peptoniphilus harei TaxID=54005 RepID=UPI0011DE137F|nr:hypothetical protein [Peptoniphilus harei]
MKNNNNSDAYNELVASLDLENEETKIEAKEDNTNAGNSPLEKNSVKKDGVISNDVINNKEKLFTQEEVDEIVKKRLSRKEKNIHDEVDKKVNDELNKRSNNLDCKEYLIENGYPKDFMEIFDNETIDNFKIKVDKVMALIKANKKEVVPPLKNPEIGRLYNDDYAKGFSVKEHVPKKLY